MILCDLSRPGPGIADIGYTSIFNDAFGPNGLLIPAMQQIMPANPSGSDDDAFWTTIWFTDPKLAAVKADTFRLPPGPMGFDPELYGRLPKDGNGKTVPMKDLDQRWVRVYRDDGHRDDTAAKGLVVGTKSRWRNGLTSTTYITHVPGSYPVESKYDFEFQLWSNALFEWSLDTRIMKFTSVLELVGGRITVG